jgi:C4-type Zn-finger protein
MENQYHIEVYPEGCCELCNEIIHNHLDCPICGKKYAASQEYYDLNEGSPVQITCSNCKSTFETKTSPYDIESVWIKITQ